MHPSERWRRLSRVTSTAMVVLALGASRVLADQGSWLVAPGVGPNEVTYTVDIVCTTGGLVCDALDGYQDAQTASLTGLGRLDLDPDAGTLQFLSDGSENLDGMGLVPVFTRVFQTDLDFAAIPFIGAPQVREGRVFATGNPVIALGGALSPGDHPFSVAIPYAALADVIGPVDAWLPTLEVAPGDVTLSGTLRVLGISPIGTVTYEIRDVSASLLVQNPAQLLGEDVVVEVTTELTMNLVGSTNTALVPALSPAGTLAVVALLAAAGVSLLRRTRGVKGTKVAR